MKIKFVKFNFLDHFLGIYKIVFAALMILGVLFVNPIQAKAANEEVTVSSASASSSSVSVSGTTDALAVMCQVRDSNNQIVAMTSLAVHNGNFSGSIVTPPLTAGATYTLYVADYEGGTFTKQDLTAPAAAPSSGGSQSNDSSGERSSSSNEGNSAQPVATKMEYTVVKGDSLRKIAWKLGVTFDSLIKWNSFANVNLIYPGQKIVYYTEQPAKENIVGDNATASDNKGRYYVVSKGDYLNKIAKKLNVTLGNILKKNIFKNINLIFPGQKIYY